MRLRLAMAGLACAGACTLPAHAQISFQPNWASWGSANLGMNTLARQQAVIHGQNPDAPRRRASVSTSYRRDPRVTRRVVDTFAASVARASNPGAAQAVRNDLGRNDLVQAWSRLAAEDGFRPGDVGDALSAYWVLNWAMANRADSDARQAAAVRAQVRPLLARSAPFARLTEGQRQEMAETFMVNFLYQQAAYTQALQARDAALMQRLSDAAEARFRNEMHVDLRGLALSPTGFVRRG